MSDLNRVLAVALAALVLAGCSKTIYMEAPATTTTTTSPAPRQLPIAPTTTYAPVSLEAIAVLAIREVVADNGYSTTGYTDAELIQIGIEICGLLDEFDGDTELLLASLAAMTVSGEIGIADATIWATALGVAPMAWCPKWK